MADVYGRVSGYNALMRKHTVSFKHAFDGVVYVFKTQPNFRFHTMAGIFVLVCAWWFGIDRSELIILLFTMMLVLVAEMLNTSIEAMTDLISTQRHPYAKISKDVAAGMVLLTAVVAVVVGGIIFTPYIIKSFNIS